MYIGEFVMTDAADCWKKNASRPVLLWKPGEDGNLVAVTNPNGAQKVVLAMNAIGTFGYKSAASRYAPIVEINETYWVISAEC